MGILSVNPRSMQCISRCAHRWAGSIWRLGTPAFYQARTPGSLLLSESDAGAAEGSLQPLQGRLTSPRPVLMLVAREAMMILETDSGEVPIQATHVRKRWGE